MSSDSGTAAERIRPWRHSSVTEDANSINSQTNKRTSNHGNDPHLHPISLTASDFSGTYLKSPEYMGEYATTTKPEEETQHRDVRDLFPKQSNEQQDINLDTISNNSVTRL